MVRYEVTGGALPIVMCHLDAGESLVAEAGAMGWMSGNIQMDVSLHKPSQRNDGTMDICRFICTQDVGMIAFPSRYPGSVLPFHLSAEESVICQRESFLCAQSTVSMPVFWRKKMPGWTSSFVLQRLIGPGVVLLCVEGVSVEYRLQAGERIRADAAHVCAMDFTVHLELRPVDGQKPGGIYLAELTGPGRIWLQSMPVPRLAGRLLPIMHK